MRSVVQAVVMSVALLVSASIPSWSEPILSLQAACSEGFAGVLQDETLRITFRACPNDPTPGDCHAQVSAGGGEPLVEVRANHGQVRAWLAGIEIENNVELTQRQSDSIAAAMLSAESLLASSLFQRLSAYGQAHDSAAMRCLNSVMQGFEWAARQAQPGQPAGPCAGCNDPATQCTGCCGKGCAGAGQTPGKEGCGTSCTLACYEHDTCAEQNGTNWGPCAWKFLEAIGSAMNCIGEAGCGGVPPAGRPPNPCQCC